MRILIVDPDTRTRRELATLFGGEGYEVETCGGLAEAVRRMKSVKFDCIIMDVELPKIRGYDAVPILKAIDPHTQIIVTAAENTKRLEAKVRGQEVFYYYIKSFDRDELKSAVHDVFSKLGTTAEPASLKGLPKILIIDDDLDFVRAISAVLERESYRIVAAHNRDEAMEKIKAERPDLIVLDIMMDRLTDGFTICYQLKHDPELKKIPVFAISAITERTGFKFSPKTDGEYFEADDYAEKPIEPAELLARIENLLKR